MCDNHIVTHAIDIKNDSRVTRQICENISEYKNTRKSKHIILYKCDNILRQYIVTPVIASWMLTESKISLQEKWKSEKIF